MNVSYLITFTTNQLQNYYIHDLCSLKSCSKVSTKRERQLIVILDTLGRLFSDLSVCQESTVCLQTTQNIQKNFVLGILHVLPTTQTMQPQKPAPVCSASQTDALDNATTQTDARALDVDWLRSVSYKSKYDVRRNIPDKSPNLIIRTGTTLRFRVLPRRLQMPTRE